MIFTLLIQHCYLPEVYILTTIILIANFYHRLYSHRHQQLNIDEQIIIFLTSIVIANTVTFVIFETPRQSPQ